MTKRTLVVILLQVLVQVIASQFTNQWAVDIIGGQAEADRVAKETGCTNQGKKSCVIPSKTFRKASEKTVNYSL